MSLDSTLKAFETGVGLGSGVGKYLQYFDSYFSTLASLFQSQPHRWEQVLHWVTSLTPDDVYSLSHLQMNFSGIKCPRW